jgi:hypothetical protein
MKTGKVILLFLFCTQIFSVELKVNSYFNTPDVKDEFAPTTAIEKGFDDILTKFYGAKKLEYKAQGLVDRNQNFHNAISGYKILSSSQNRIVLQADVNDKVALENYRKYYLKKDVADVKNIPDGKKIYLKFHYKSDFQWVDLNFKGEDDFYNSIVVAWKKWIESDLRDKGQDAKVFLYNEMLVKSVDANSFIYDVKATISKTVIDNEFKRFGFDIQVDQNLLDYKLNPIGKNQEFNDHELLTAVQGKDVPNILANKIYRLPLNGFKSTRMKLVSLFNSKFKTRKIIVNSQKSYLEIERLIEFINTQGVMHQMQASIEKVLDDGYELKLRFNGEDSNVFKFFHSVDRSIASLEIKEDVFPLVIDL